MTQTIDDATMHLLRHQGQRMQHFLHGVVPPNRAEALRVQVRVDEILDRRPKPVAVASDGEVIWPGASPFVVDQATYARNATDKPEVILTAEQHAALTAEPPLEPNGGGVGLMDRPEPNHYKQDEIERRIERARKDLGL